MSVSSENATRNQLGLQIAQGLDALFCPASIAIVGASESPNSVGNSIFKNLTTGAFNRPVYAVNPHREQVMGMHCYPSVKDIPCVVDLAVIAVPAPAVPEVMEQCGQMGIKAAVIVSAGFRETGLAGQQLEEQVQACAARYNIRVIGPNCLGIMIPRLALNASFASSMAKPGGIAFLSQSGALCTSVLDWSLQANVGFSAFVSAGSMADVSWGDLISYFGDDPYTKCIVLYMETIGDARSFLSAAREVALSKPIIVHKAGRTKAASAAAISHTGAMTGEDSALDAAFRRAGVLRVNSIAELFYMANILDKQPIPKGPRLTIITNAGGPAIVATDSLVESGGTLAKLSPNLTAALNDMLPPHWSHGNPIDLLGDAGPCSYAKVLETVAHDPDTDGIMLILTPQSMSDPTETARVIAEASPSCAKPILASWMGGEQVDEGRKLLREAGIPVFPYPDTPAKLYGYMWQHAQNLKALYETPSILPHESDQPTDSATASALIDAVSATGATLLNEWESKGLLRAYGIPVSETVPAKSADDAVFCAQMLGYPVVLKLLSGTVTHKSDVKGVRLDLHSEAAVRDAYNAIKANVTSLAGPDAFEGVTVQPMVSKSGYELILGSHMDAQLGPVMLFGTGGRNAELINDKQLGLPPLTTALARRMMDQTKAYQMLQHPRDGSSATLKELEGLMVRFSQLVVEHPRIKEIEINPLLITGDSMIALDARVVLHEEGAGVSVMPPAIRPYPHQYVFHEQLDKDLKVIIRPVRPEDEPLIVEFHKGLSDRTVYLRYFHPNKLSQRISHARLTRTCFLDYDREIALAAVIEGENGQPVITAVGRLARDHSKNSAELALVVSDAYQNRGIGTAVLKRLLNVARSEQMGRVRAEMLTDNLSMQRICERMGFVLTSPHPDSVSAVLSLS